MWNNSMKTILIVADDQRIAAGLKVQLQAANYAVLTATDGLEAIKLALQQRPDLILMDAWMPGALGFLIAQRLQPMGLEQCPIIFLTAGRMKGLWQPPEELDSP